MLECRHGGHDLERRPRGVLAADAFVDQRRARIGAQLLPRAATQPAAEQAGIEAGDRGERHHAAGTCIQHDGARRGLGGQALDRKSLQLEIERQPDVLACHALLPAELADLTAEGVDLDPAETGTATQYPVVASLDAALADAELGQMQERVRVLRLLADVHRADIAQHMRESRTLRVVPQQTGIQCHARKLGGPDREPRHLVPAQVLAHQERHERPPDACLGQDGVDPLRGQLDYAGNPLQDSAQVVRLLADHEHAVGGHVPRQGSPEPVENAATWRREQPLIGAIVLGEQRKLLAALDLQVVEPSGERREHRGLCPAEQQGPPAEGAGPLNLVVHGPPPSAAAASPPTPRRADRPRP